MEQLITDHPELEHALRGIEDHVFIDHLEGSEYQVSFHPDPWMTESQVAAWIYAATDPDRIVMETGIFNGLDEEKNIIPDELLNEKGKDLFRHIALERDDETNKVVEECARRAANHPGERFLFVMPIGRVSMDTRNPLWSKLNRVGFSLP